MSKTQNPLTTVYKTPAEKRKAYEADAAAGKRAYYEKGHFVPLKKMKLNQVEFIKGKWRVQNPAPYAEKIIVDGYDIYLGSRIHDKLPANSAEFKFYDATPSVTWCENGMQIFKFDLVAAVYETSTQQIWAIGRDAAAARTNLIPKVYEEFKDIIKTIATHNWNIKKR